MKKLFCSYCGEPLENGCRCEIDAEQDRLDRLEEYYNDPEVQFGWYQQDIIDTYRRER